MTEDVVINPVEDQFLNAEKFHHIIEDLVWKHDIGHFEAVIMYCNDNDIEIDDVVKYCKGPLKDMMELDCINNGLLPKKSKLEIFE